MQRLRTFTLVIGLSCASLTAVAQTIGFSNSDSSDKYRGLLQQAAVSYATGNGSVKLEVRDARGDGSKQVAHVKSLIDAKASAIIVVPATTATGPMTELARQAGIPIVYVNQRPAEAMGSGAAYVGSDEMMAGRLQGEQLVRRTGGKGEIAILKGPAAHDATVGRTKGLKGVISARAEIKVVAEETANWSRSEGKAVTAGILKKFPGLAAIVANNDEMALGAVDALREAGVPSGKVLVMGVDATPDAIAAVKDGSLGATVLQNARGQGRGAVDVALKMIAKGNVPKELMIPFELVTKENLAQFESR